MDRILELLFESMPYPLWVKDLDNRYTKVNDSFLQLFGLHKEAVIGKTDEHVFSSDFVTPYSEAAEKVKQTLIPQKFEQIIDHKLRECLIYPILSNQQGIEAIAGIITEPEEKVVIQQQLMELSHKDTLTGVYNRNYFKEMINKFSSKLYLPLSVIMCDINGLRLLNGAFGHLEGDKHIKLVADVLRESCEEWGHIFRWGGDEFIILLPNHDEKLCEKTIKEIMKNYKSHKHGFLELSLSVGSATTNILNEQIYEVVKEAESHLFRQKLLSEKSVRGSIMFSLQNSLEAKNVETEKHTERMVNYSLALGRLLDFKISQMDELELVTKLHDIGKIGISEDILLKPGKLTEEEFEVMKTHTEKGLRIVEASNELAHIGRGILTHHERWDGKGYPLGLKGEEIPLVSRIVSVVDSYDAMTNDRVYRKAMTKEEAVLELKRCAGHQFDPKIVELFISLIENEKA